jgi:hypothetical protein
MHDLDPHVAFRTRHLQDEADARRLAGSATRDGPGRASPSDLRRVLATTVIALSIAAGSSGAYLALGAEPMGVGSVPPPVSPRTVDPAPAPSMAPTGGGMAPSGGLLVHR